MNSKSVACVTVVLASFPIAYIIPVPFVGVTLLSLICAAFINQLKLWRVALVFIPMYFLMMRTVFFVLIFIVERGWCRYFCPVGALLAPFNKVSFLHVSVDKKECTHCNICSEVCPMGIDVPSMNRDPECILCGKCVNACPKNLIKFRRI